MAKRDFSNPLDKKVVETGEPEGTEKQQEQTEQTPEEEQNEKRKTTVTTSTNSYVLEEVEEAFKDYFSQLNRDKIDDRAVRTTIHVDKDLSELLNTICYRKQGLKTKIVNYALRAFLKDGRALELAEQFDKMKKNKNNYDKQYYEKLLKQLNAEK
jgi:hypothetical protein